MAVLQISMAAVQGFVNEEGEGVPVAWEQSVTLLRTTEHPSPYGSRTVFEHVGRPRRRSL